MTRYLRVKNTAKMKLIAVANWNDAEEKDSGVGKARVL